MNLGLEGAAACLVTPRAYLKIFHPSRAAAFTSSESASLLAKRPYDKRHAAVSTWLNPACPLPGRRAGRPQHRCPAARLRQVHLRPTARGEASYRRGHPASRRRVEDQLGHVLGTATRRETPETASSRSWQDRPRTGLSQFRGHFSWWWQVLGSNQRRLSRRFYRPLPLATRATCRAPSHRTGTVKDSGTRPLVHHRGAQSRPGSRPA